MVKKISSQWLSVYLFYNEPWETFLEKALYPYVNTLKQTGIAEKYFFIRYHEKGPHIRLRIKGDPEVITSIVRPNLEEYFLQYYESRPSFRVDPPKSNWNPNNTIVFSKYQPEKKRFGGQYGMQLAEDHFEASSNLVLELIKSKGQEWNYENALGAAIQIHLIMMAALGFNRLHTSLFFQAFFQNWSQFLLQHSDTTKKVAPPKEAFERAYQIQKNSINPMIQNLWLGLEKDPEFDNPTLAQWFHFNKELKARYEKAYQNLQLHKPTEETPFLWPTSFSPNKKDSIFWPILSDLLHLTNNRLGILNQDEGYLGYLLMKGLEAAKQMSINNEQ